MSEKSLVEFIERITLANGPYPYLDGKSIVADAYRVLAAHNGCCPRVIHYKVKQPVRLKSISHWGLFAGAFIRFDKFNVAGLDEYNAPKFEQIDMPVYHYRPITSEDSL